MNLGQWGHMKQVTDPKTGQTTYTRTSAFGPTRAFGFPTHIPCQNPPFGELVAVNVNTGEIAWRACRSAPFRNWKRKASKTRAASIWAATSATASGLIFLSAANDGLFRAFGLQTGKELWRKRWTPPLHRAHHLSWARREAVGCSDYRRRRRLLTSPTSDSVIASLP